MLPDPEVTLLSVSREIVMRPDRPIQQVRALAPWGRPCETFASRRVDLQTVSL